MNIIYFSHSDLTSKQANNIHVLNMCAALTKSGHNVKLFVWKKSNKYNNNNEYNKILKKYGIINKCKIYNYPVFLPILNSIFTSIYLSLFIFINK